MRSFDRSLAVQGPGQVVRHWSATPRGHAGSLRCRSWNFLDDLQVWITGLSVNGSARFDGRGYCTTSGIRVRGSLARLGLSPALMRTNASPPTLARGGLGIARTAVSVCDVARQPETDRRPWPKACAARRFVAIVERKRG